MISGDKAKMEVDAAHQDEDKDFYSRVFDIVT